VFFDAEIPFFNYEDMHSKTKIREKESKLLIDFISTPKFMEQLGLKA